MSHEKYRTEAYLIVAKDSGEADKNFKFYTKDFGLIIASARGIRKLESKLKSHIDVCVPLSLTLVKGLHVWRLVEVTKKSIAISTEVKKRFLRALGILSRFVQGEEKNEELFNLIDLYWKFLASSLNKEALPEAGELVVDLEMLRILGYGNSSVVSISTNNPFSETVLNDVFAKRNLIISSINKAIQQTHL